MKRTIFSLAAGAALALGLAATAMPARAQDELKLGVVGALTGPFTAATKDTLDGLNAWIKVHGVAGKKATLEVLDDETNPVNASNAFRRLASDPAIPVIFMFSNSNAGLAIKSFASEFKVPIISGGGAEALGMPVEPWLFKVAPSNRDNMIVVSRYAQQKGYKKIAILYSTDSFGTYDYNNLKDVAPTFGLTLVSAESFAIEDTNFNAQLARIIAAKPDIIYSSASSRGAILFFKTYKQLGITTPLVLAQSAISAAFYDAIGGADKANGTLLPQQRGAFGTALGGDTAKYYTELQGALGHLPVYFNTFGYDAGIIFGAGYANSDGSRQGLRDAIEKEKDVPAVNGPVTYSATDHTGQDDRSLALGKLENGVSVPAD